ncbi:MAG: hypothetical protein L7W43_04175, partial [Rubripirellula sp.]|nr:hypothetical protein [Rubripirellula sp.]
MMKYIGSLISLSLLVTAANPAVMAQAIEEREGPFSLPSGLHKTMLLKPGPGNPRNSEGDFIQLSGGRLL